MQAKDFQKLVTPHFELQLSHSTSIQWLSRNLLENIILIKSSLLFLLIWHPPPDCGWMKQQGGGGPAASAYLRVLFLTPQSYHRAGLGVIYLSNSILIHS